MRLTMAHFLLIFRRQEDFPWASAYWSQTMIPTSE
jgi:hypothetical protein